MTPTVVMWFRRDLRLTDLPALHAAAAEGRRVVPLFVVDPAFGSAGVGRRAFMRAALMALDASMDRALVYRHGRPEDIVPAFAAEVGAAAVFVSQEHTPYGRRRDALVGERLAADGRRLIGIGSHYAVTPGSVTKADGTPYGVFTPFCKQWRARGWDAPSGVPTVDWYGAPAVHCDGPPPAVPDDMIPTAAREFHDEVAAWARWESWLPEAARYHETRDLMALDGTSRLSAALRWGVVHPRQLLADLDDRPDRTRGHEVLGNELGWREFYADVLFHKPHTAWSNLNPKMDAMPVDTDGAALRRLEAWEAGMTGYPVIDAAMRQLRATGWMHNRARMLVASFLVKDLHLPWQWGARHFMRHLCDGDLASNAHGWQWTAGTGTDAAPYFRVFNPITQGQRFDAEGEYVRRWVPELAGRSGASAHLPGGGLLDGYPDPIVDHAREREESLARYRLVTSARD